MLAELVSSAAKNAEVLSFYHFFHLQALFAGSVTLSEIYFQGKGWLRLSLMFQQQSSLCTTSVSDCLNKFYYMKAPLQKQVIE